MIPIYSSFTDHLNQLIKSDDHTQESDWSRLLEIRTQVREKGDVALKHYAHLFDKVSLESFTLWVSDQERAAAYAQLPRPFIQALRKAKQNISRFHRYQRPKNWTKSFGRGIQAGVQFTPIHRVGLYVPGGRAVYPSSVLMNAIPAHLAGVSDIVIATPPQANGSIHPAILVAADLCGVTKILKSGGAQAIFALAYGTQTVAGVDKITGPGNQYVTLAKQMVAGRVAIDKPAGPSEVIIYCSELRYAPFAAAELLAQQEHDPQCVAIAVSESKLVLEKIQQEWTTQLQQCSRSAIIQESAKRSGLWLVANQTEAIDAINAAASEHVVLLCEHPQDLAPLIQNGSSLFLGAYSPVTLGDYFAGPNHILPTNRGARYASPLGVMDFMKFSSILHYSKEALATALPHLKSLTQMEGLDAHYQAASLRINR